MIFLWLCLICRSFKKVKGHKLVFWFVTFDQNAISWPLVRSSKVSYHNNHNECGFNFHVEFMPYRSYRLLKKQPKVYMFLMQFYVIFFILAFLLDSIKKIVNIDTKLEYWKSIEKDSKYWHKIRIFKIYRRNWFYFPTICLIIMCDV